MRTVLQDLRFGLRMLAKNPGFTAVAVLTLALGIGLNAGIFSMVNVFLFRPLTVQHPEQIATFSAEENHGGFSNGFSYPDFQEIRNQTGAVFSDVTGARILGATGLTIDGKSERMWTDFVAGNFFDMLGVRPALGRLILPSEGRVAGADPVLVLGYSFWKVHLGGDPNIVGQKALVNGHPVTIVGVAPEGFRPLSSFMETQGYMPLGMAVVDAETKSDFLSDPQAKEMVLTARMKPGVTASQIHSVLDVVAKRMSAAHPKADDWRTLDAFPLSPVGPSSSPDTPFPMVSAFFLTLAAVVLMLACVNVANILLARASGRRSEIAIRAALGARRSRLIGQLLTESFLLALLGCGGGILVGLGANQVLSALPLHTDLPMVLDFHFDWRVFAYALAVALAAGIMSGLAPAWRTTGGDLNELLHGSARITRAGGRRFREVLVMAQVGGSLALLIVAGLFVRSLVNVERADLGFDPQHVLNLTPQPNLAGYNPAQADKFMQGLRERVRALPGVQAASLAATVPMGYMNMGDNLEVEGQAPSPGKPGPSAGWNAVSPGYFETMRIHLLRGRGINETDTAASPRIAVINQAMAERFWPGQDPMGKQFKLASDPADPVQVVGVVNNSRTGGLDLTMGPFFFLPLAQKHASPVTLQVRTDGDPKAMAAGILGLIRSQAPAVPVSDVQTMTDALDTLNGLFLFKLGAGLAAVMGLAGLLLALIGVYGVVSHMAAQRTREIGIRLALGAAPGEILRTVLREGIAIAAIGSLVGILLAFAVARIVGHFLVGVSPTDPLTYVGVSSLLLLVALAASYIPARRATKVDPIVALRYE